MDPQIGWLQPEQVGPAQEFWSRILDSSEDTDSNDDKYSTETVQEEEDEDEYTLPLDWKFDFSIDDQEIKTSNLYEHGLFTNIASTYDMNKMQAHYIGKFGGCPWRHGKSYDRQPICTLHKEIEDFFAYMSATPEEHSMRLDVLERVTNVIHAEWPKAKVEVFGSFRTGLYLPTSDMDLVVIGEWDTLPLHSLAQALLKNNVCNENIQVLDKASVPIVKMTDKATDVRVDISFNMNNGVKSAEMIKHYMDVFPMLPKLVLVLKQFLAQRDMNEVFYGGISSYSLILMVVSFLQLHPRGDLNYPTANLGVLLIEFFELYGKKFNYMHTAIRVKDGGLYISKDEVQKDMADGHRPSILCIEDPLTPGNDIGRGSYGALQVKSVFEYAFTTLKAALDPQIVSPSFSILGRIVRVNDKVILYRQWVRDTYALQNTQRVIINNYLTTSNISNNVSVSTTTSSRASTVSSGSGSAESDSESSIEKLSDAGDHNDQNSNYQPRRKNPHYHRHNSWNNQQNYQMINSGNHPSTRNQRIICTSPANNYQQRGFTNNNYNNSYNHHQNYRPNAGNKHQYTGNYQPHFGNFMSSKRQKRKNQTQDVR
ncbi:non-canonical poly(A) RNA polymerase PAPD5-like isoform X1 [Myzus persicae]|uniref:non-canonical poly(A) RNA polymerase PAPD5-like isoform X1 n=1 Tax=Myzus persicae TaxID=13164 RepID=UPI000B92FCA3|nr:non-canonical poly(A) RNA polymerase PAPD5-like isoform X1 [Myzus persicae]XP_022176532.1 non-canonical poly(A) RNA polymerase PAPD5-like isoform X1 [Myzus persicae]XP_022176533.1 non-canonical poly(A) RNA polymerase PAPD5-like isoform X1 [Myzus persicae]XP_022176534.1 non-canonical poly(A) RNA polymerase PAPD5-like isoform X1 [Myzus persicae]